MNKRTSAEVFLLHFYDVALLSKIKILPELEHLKRSVMVISPERLNEWLKYKTLDIRSFRVHFLARTFACLYA